MSGAAPGSDFTKRLQEALNRAKTTGAPTGLKASRAPSAAPATPITGAADGDSISLRISSALQKAKKGSAPAETGGATFRPLKTGESLADIAAESGLGASEIWNHPLNRQLREERGDAGALRPGDALFVPEAAGPGGPVGEGDYVVRQGDCMASIAVEHGFFWQTLWDEPPNSQLKTVRADPYVLLPGDRVTIPEKRRKDESIAPEQRHRFKRKGCPEKLVIHFRSGGQPRAAKPYELSIDGKVTKGVTDPNGRVEVLIPPAAANASIVFPESGESYELDLGHLDPITETSGVQGRLRNLGLYRDRVDGVMNKALSAALRSFQLGNALDPTGVMDDASRSALQQAHGS